MVSTTPSTSQLTPNHVPPASSCLLRSAVSTSVASKPLLMASWRGTISSALAKARTTSWSLPAMPSAASRSALEISISMAPPPPTTRTSTAPRLTIMSASWMERCDSSMYCSEPPRSTMVAVLAPGQPVKTLKRSPPTCFSSNEAHVPQTPGRAMSSTDVWTTPPVALETRRMSSSGTRPAQNRPRSAKYCVAKSPMGSLERTTLAPEATQRSSFS
mmetsp:Transcript_1370/g.4191  ORF Transcript_1370/g.4191 Transcript_1370/m.4191 type:complete len:216 (+) Transcript_1370:453-1100(+)